MSFSPIQQVFSTGHPLGTPSWFPSGSNKGNYLTAKRNEPHQAPLASCRDTYLKLAAASASQR